MNLAPIRKIAAKQLYRWFFSTFTFILLLSNGYQLLSIKQLKPTHLLVGLCVFTLIAFYRSRPTLQKVFLLLALFSGLLILHFIVGFQEMLQFYQGYGSWLVGNANASGMLLTLYLVMQLLLLSIVSELIATAFLRFPVLQFFALCGLCITLFVFYFIEYAPSQLSIAMMFAYVLFLFVQCVHRKRSKSASEHGERTRRYVTYLIPFFVCLALFLFITPAPKKPYDWYYVRQLLNRIQNRFLTSDVNSRSNLKEDFNFGMGGFDEELSLDGSAENSDNARMEVDCYQAQNMPLYLTGFLLADFDGREWTSRTSPEALDSTMDAIETFYAVSGVTQYPHDYLGYSSASVVYRYFHSKHQFLPAKSFRFSVATRLEGKNDKVLGYGSSYDCNYFQLNLPQSLFVALLETKHEDDASRWQTVAANLNRSGEDCSFEALLAYRERMKARYGGSYPISDELKAWLDAFDQPVSSTNVNGYRRLLELEQLFSSFTYTTEPGELPDTIDSPSEFLDYFCLETKTGYCTYFATAFVLLARNYGYPARLCQGFLASVDGTTHTVVRGTDAHAWPEVYFEGIGWIPFEPTPGHADLRYVGWAAKSELDTTTDWFAPTTPPPSQPVTPDASTAKKESEDFAPDPAAIVKTVILWVLLLLVLSILLPILHVKNLVRLYQKKDLAAKASWLAHRNLQHLQRLTRKRALDETLAEYAIFLHQGALPGQKTLCLTERMLYGGHIVLEGDVIDVMAESDEIIALGRKRNRLRFYGEELINRALKHEK